MASRPSSLARTSSGGVEEAPPRRRVPKWVERGLHKALPTLLLLSFLVFPMVSSLAFRAWACEEFEDAAYLRDDYSVTCWTTSEHRRIVRMAVAGILICAPPWRPEPSERHRSTPLRVPLFSPLLSRARVAFAAADPVGITLLYMALFRAARHAIAAGRPTALSSALGFLTRDFEVKFYYWEIVEARTACPKRQSWVGHSSPP